MILAKCIKETYTWECDNRQHRFSKVVAGHIYGFNKIEKNRYCIVPEASSTDDFKDANGFIDCVARGLDKKYFDEMFEIVS